MSQIMVTIFLEEYSYKKRLLAIMISIQISYHKVKYYFLEKARTNNRSNKQTPRLQEASAYIKNESDVVVR